MLLCDGIFVFQVDMAYATNVGDAQVLFSVFYYMFFSSFLSGTPRGKHIMQFTSRKSYSSTNF